MKSTPYILLIDDDPQILLMMKRALEKEGYEAIALTSGRAALDSIQERRPDLVILDLSMPEPDGFDILRIERAQRPQLNIVVMSGYLSGALLEVARLLGAIGTIQKPFSAEELVQLVREILL
jgi:DNA-binding response OmpR family regulator